MQVSIYVETSSNYVGKKSRTIAYLLEHLTSEGPYTKSEVFSMDGTYNQTVLAAVVRALERIKMPCEVLIRTKNKMLIDMITYQLPDWEKRDFKKKDGTPIKNEEEWRRYAIQSHKHYIFLNSEHHGYESWMKGEIERYGNGKRNDILHAI